MENFYTSACFGNTIGLISLIIGIVSLALTIYVSHKAKTIEDAIKETKRKTTRRINLKNVAPDLAKELSDKYNAIEKTEYVSWNISVRLLSIFSDMEPYKICFNQEDLKTFENAYDYLKNFKGDRDKDKIKELLIHIAKTIGILKRGEYLE